MSHDEGQTCVCVAQHRPVIDELDRHHVVPLAWDGPDVARNVVWVCPNAHRMVHGLLRAYQRANGEPSWDVRRRFSPYIRDLAARGWAERP